MEDGGIPEEDTQKTEETSQAKNPFEIDSAAYPVKKRPRKALIAVGICCALVAIVGIGFSVRHKTTATTTAKDDGTITLKVATTWSQLQVNGVYENGKLKSKGLQQYLDDYTKLHPKIRFQISSMNLNDYPEKLELMHQTGDVPDIYQTDSQWSAPFVAKGMLAKPPQAIIDDVSKNYYSTASVTVDSQIWGIPTEIDDYALLYNKQMFAEAGITTPPKTWVELVKDANKLTKRQGKTITQYGFAFSKDDYEIEGDGFLSLLYSNGGALTSASNGKSLLNSPAAVEVLKAQKQLFDQGSTDLTVSVNDFAKGKVAMAIVPPRIRSGLHQGLGDKYDTQVAIAPLPIFKKPATFQYNWFTGVMARSSHQQEAWDFLQWFTAETQTDSQTTRYGDLLVNTIGAMPSRKIDMQNQKALSDPFMSVFVGQLSNSVAVPNVTGFYDIQKGFMSQLEAAWTGQKTPEAALNSAAQNMDTILANNKQQ
jgi:multiple sugar transport system substrate-binding protein